jgi:chemotaxis protein MotB
MSRRRRQVAEADDSGRWLATYGDVVTLLLAFFVLLYAISQVDQRKFQLFVSGLEAPFGNTSASPGLLAASSSLDGSEKGPLPDDPDLAAVDEGLGLIPEGAVERTEEDEHPEQEVPPPTMVELPDPEVLITAQDLIDLKNQLQSELSAVGLEEFVDFRIDHRGLVIAIATDEVVFESGQIEISSAGYDILSVIGPRISGFSNAVLVEGHTDDVPLLREGYDNWNLSADRALAVLHLLSVEFGIDQRRLAATGYGEFQPVVDESTDAARSKNRRVELVIVAGKE